MHIFGIDGKAGSDKQTSHYKYVLDNQKKNKGLIAKSHSENIIQFIAMFGKYEQKTASSARKRTPRKVQRPKP